MRGRPEGGNTHTAIQTAQTARDLAIQMVPDGHFDEDETDQRRALWEIWAVLPDGSRAVYPAILAKMFNQPIEWVREALNLNAGVRQASNGG